MSEAKFTSFTTCDFLNEIDLNLFIEALEKTAPIWVREMKPRGLIKWSLNRVWNQKDVCRIIMCYEYRDKSSYEANRAYIDQAFQKNKAWKKLRPTAKFSTSRCIVVMEV